MFFLLIMKKGDFVEIQAHITVIVTLQDEIFSQAQVIKPFNPASIKEALLRWCQHKLQGYPVSYQLLLNYLGQ